MTDPAQLVFDTLVRVYGSDLTGIDLFKYSPAQAASYVTERLDTGGLLALLRDLGMALTVVFGLILVFVFMKAQALRAEPSKAAVSGELGTLPVPDGPLRKQWERVLGHLDSPREEDWKVAVMEADKLVDLALAKADVPGSGMGERLANLGPGRLASFQGLGWAHGVRNRLAHEVNYFLRYTEAKQAIGYFEQALNELGAI